MNSPEEAIAKACCADLYQSELAGLILGDTLHPGGLRLTNRLGRLMGVSAGDRVVDLASGRGESARAVSRVFHCSVVGVEYGAPATRQARSGSLEAPAPTRAHFVQGDAESPPLKSSCFDAVFCECSASLFVNKSRAVSEVMRLLRPGGKFGFSDVTVEPGSLPDALGGDVGRLLCLADALPVSGYVRLVEEGGMRLLHQENASQEVIKLLDELEGKLGAFLAWQSLAPQRSEDSELFQRIPQLLATARQLTQAGKLGYWLFVAEKPGGAPY